VGPARVTGVGSVAGALAAAAIAWPASPAALAAPAAGPPAAAACSPQGAVRTPSPGSYDGLYGVSALSSGDVWAVGGYHSSKNRADETLAERWDGTRFRRSPSPDPQPDDVLLGVAAVSATDVWAVGRAWSKSVAYATLIQHFDGKGWSTVPSPPLRTGSGLLAAVAAGSAGDVWAVGSQFTGPGATGSATLVERWNGTAWRVVPSPDPNPYGAGLDSVTVVSPRDVWAVGSSGNSGDGTSNLIEHWNGTRWSVVPSPDPGIDDSLRSVSAVSATDAWAVGGYATDTGSGSLDLTLAVHFDGRRWSMSPTPSPSDDDDLLAVAAVTARDVWAVGGGAFLNPLVERWNGARWRAVVEPYRHGNLNTPYAVTAGTAPGVWAAGSLGGTYTLALHFCER
jgi:hypothetical protein